MVDFGWYYRLRFCREFSSETSLKKNSFILFVYNNSLYVKSSTLSVVFDKVNNIKKYYEKFQLNCFYYVKPFKRGGTLSFYTKSFEFKKGIIKFLPSCHPQLSHSNPIPQMIII